jgi:hypothetical protein
VEAIVKVADFDELNPPGDAFPLVVPRVADDRAHLAGCQFLSRRGTREVNFLCWVPV